MAEHKRALRGAFPGVGAEPDAVLRTALTDLGHTPVSYGHKGEQSSGVPQNMVRPVISGTRAVGETLTVTNGAWAFAPTSYTRQWKRDGVNIASATNATYVLVSADGGTTITTTVTATNATGSASATSAGVAIPEPDISLPDVASATRLGDVRASTGLTTSVTGFAGTGTIGRVGNTVTGLSTAFLSEVVVGDRVTSALSTIDGIVTAITDNTTLTISTSGVVGGGLSYTITPQASTARATAWANAGTAGGSFTQSGSARPVKRKDGGGHPYLEFAALAGQWMLGPAIANNLSAFACFAVVSPGDTGFNGPVLSKTTSYATGQGWYFDISSSLIQAEGGSDYYSVDWDNTGLDTAVPHVYAWEKVSNTEMHMYIDGVLKDDDSGGTQHGSAVTDFSTSEPLRIGATADEDPSITYHVRAIRIYQITNYAAWDASDRQAIIADMAADTGVTL